MYLERGGEKECYKRKEEEKKKEGRLETRTPCRSKRRKEGGRREKGRVSKRGGEEGEG